MLLRSGECPLSAESIPPSLLKVEFDSISPRCACGHIIANESLAIVINTIFRLCQHNYLHLHFYTVNRSHSMYASFNLSWKVYVNVMEISIGDTGGLCKFYLHSISWALMWRSYTLKPLNNLRHIYWNS